MWTFDYNNFLERLFKIPTLLKVRQFVIPNYYYLFILLFDLSHSITSILKHLKL